MSDLKSEGNVPGDVEIVDLEGSAGNGNGNGKVNKQLYGNSGLGDSPVADVLNLIDGALYNRRDPNLAILHEKPEHRIILLLKLKGYSNREIARETGYQEAWISQVCRQPWFQVHLTQALNQGEAEIVDKIVAVEATNSIYTLVNLRDTAKSEAVRASCATEILNRHLGKPIQRQEIVGSYEYTLTKVEKIEHELEEVEREERRLMTLGTDQG